MSNSAEKVISKAVVIACAAWVIVAFSSGNAQATPIAVTFTKIVDTGTPIPGGIGTFTGLGNEPFFRSGSVTFSGFGSGGQAGVYRSVGGTLGIIADTNTSVPGGTGNFPDFEDPAPFSGATVVFPAFNGGGRTGIYSSIGGSLSVVADTNTSIPGGTGNFFSVGSVKDFDGTTIAFRGQGASGQSGVYTSVGGSLSVVADTNTPIPGGGDTFAGFADKVALSGNAVTFIGFAMNGPRSVYLAPTAGGSLSVVADGNTPIPGGTGNFTGTGDPSLSDETVVFDGSGSGGQNGVYISIGGLLGVIADTNTPIPDGTGNFEGVGGAVLVGDTVWFYGEGTGDQKGIYVFQTGILQTVIDTSSLLDGKTIVEFDYCCGTADGLAFKATFADGSLAIYTAQLATVPEPATLLLMSIGALAALAWIPMR